MTAQTSREAATQLRNRALELVRADPLMAYRCAASAVLVDPSWPDAWLLLGNQLSDQGNLAASIAAFRRGLGCPDLDLPTRLRLTVNLGHRLMLDGQFEEAETVTDEAIRMFHRNGAEAVGGVEAGAFAHTNRSLIYSHRGLLGSSVVEAYRGWQMLPEPITEMGYAFALLFNKDYAAGLKHFHARFDYKLPSYINLPWPVWDGKFADTLIVMCEQGLGDTVSFSRFVPEAARIVDRVIFQVQPELVRLMADALRDHRNVTVVAQDYRLPRADAWIAVFSLPVALGLDTAEIAGWPGLEIGRMDCCPLPPGVEIDPEKFNVVVAYAGNPGNDIDRHRSVEPSWFLRLADIPGVALHSVQVGERTRRLHELGCVSMVADLSPSIRDARDTAAVLRHCDLVVACESFVGHLAGSMSVPCWIAASKLGRDWRLGVEGETTLWYSRTRVFRQGDDRSWGPVFEAMRSALTALVEKTDG